MRYTSTVSSKGQVTLPVEIRRRLGLKQGDRVDFVVERERTVLQPHLSSENPFARYAGILGKFPGGTEGIKAWVRELRSDREPRQPGVKR